LLTAHEQIGKEVAALLNMITGYAKAPALQHVLVAPHTLRTGLAARIRREIDNAASGRPARIRGKMNAIVDPGIIRLLYEASQAGVRVELCVRGICCLRPGVPGLSENIHVVSVVGRFLEHSRIYEFLNDGAEPEVFLASADWMTRNLDRRVEQAVPILDPALRERVREILDAGLHDTRKARRILADGTYEPVAPAPGAEPFDSQEWLRQRATREARRDADESE
ncbi:MAG: Polyphosphate kinase, partial [Planctomycetota bacterium]